MVGRAARYGIRVSRRGSSSGVSRALLAHARMAPGGRIWSESPVKEQSRRVQDTGGEEGVVVPTPTGRFWMALRGWFVGGTQDCLYDERNGIWRVPQVGDMLVTLAVSSGTFTPPAGWRVLSNTLVQQADTFAFRHMIACVDSWTAGTPATWTLSGPGTVPTGGAGGIIFGSTVTYLFSWNTPGAGAGRVWKTPVLQSHVMPSSVVTYTGDWMHPGTDWEFSLSTLSHAETYFNAAASEYNSHSTRCGFVSMGYTTTTHRYGGMETAVPYIDGDLAQFNSGIGESTDAYKVGGLTYDGRIWAPDLTWQIEAGVVLAHVATMGIGPA